MNSQTELHIKNFDGPLDLLLELVKEKQMDIFDIDLVELTSDYVRIINELKDTNIDLASEYLVMAATLVQLKAKMLLETPEAMEDVELEKEGLLKQLIEYQQFKQIADKLKVNEKSRSRLHVKETSDYSPYEAPVDETKLDGTSDAINLIMQLRKMFERVNAKKLRETTIEKFNLSPAERRVEIVKLLKTKSKPTFEDIFNVPTMNHFVVTMLTILDMARKQELIINQEKQFGEITFVKGEING